LLTVNNLPSNRWRFAEFGVAKVDNQVFLFIDS